MFARVLGKQNRKEIRRGRCPRRPAIAAAVNEQTDRQGCRPLQGQMYWVLQWHKKCPFPLRVRERAMDIACLATGEIREIWIRLTPIYHDSRTCTVTLQTGIPNIIQVMVASPSPSQVMVQPLVSPRTEATELSLVTHRTSAVVTERSFGS